MSPTLRPFINLLLHSGFRQSHMFEYVCVHVCVSVLPVNFSEWTTKPRGSWFHATRLIVFDMFHAAKTCRKTLKILKNDRFHWNLSAVWSLCFCLILVTIQRTHCGTKKHMVIWQTLRYRMAASRWGAVIRWKSRDCHCMKVILQHELSCDDHDFSCAFFPRCFYVCVYVQCVLAFALRLRQLPPELAVLINTSRHYSISYCKLTREIAVLLLVGE